MCEGVVAKARARIKIKGGLKIDNAASRRRVFRIICIMLIIAGFIAHLPDCSVFLPDIDPPPSQNHAAAPYYI